MSSNWCSPSDATSVCPGLSATFITAGEGNSPLVRGGPWDSGRSIAEPCCKVDDVVDKGVVTWCSCVEGESRLCCSSGLLEAGVDA